MISKLAVLPLPLELKLGDKFAQKMKLPVIVDHRVAVAVSYLTVCNLYNKRDAFG